ncbi:alsin [Orussus abietinus]|uniref:alsin n=1 Tax=Orussus abietinus TaxID=222816 RepID=UPI0006266106|nr:alsin [Orussus abietinus]
MEKSILLWRNDSRVLITFCDEPNAAISKLVTINDYVFIATTTCDLYYGEVKITNNSPSVVFNRTDFHATDISSNSKYVFVVNPEGHVLKINPIDLTIVDTIILKEELRQCIHGNVEEENILKVRSIDVNDDAALFVTQNGQLWASGKQPQINVNTVQPKKVIFFENHHVFQVACGFNFQIALTRKSLTSTDDDSDSEKNPEQDVIISSCPQCVINMTNIRASMESSNTSALEVYAQQKKTVNNSHTLSLENKPLEAISSPKDLLNSENSFLDSDEHSSSFTDSGKEEKKNLIFIKNESAQQFLTRQLSWVSSYKNVGEGLLAECTDRPTRLIKQNVSNMAYYVHQAIHDSVKTVSKHISGNSNNHDVCNDGKNFEVLELEDTTLKNKTSNSSCYDELFSSTESSEYDLSEHNLQEGINLLVQAGKSILVSELWIWGSNQHGQLGTGDMIQRDKPISATKFHYMGITKVVSGHYHTIVLTLDGRVYHWGRNNSKQVSTDSLSYQSSPQLFGKSSTSRERVVAVDIAAGDKHSLIMSHLQLHFLGETSEQKEFFYLDDLKSSELNMKQIMCSGIYSCCYVTLQSVQDITSELQQEQIFLEEIVTVYQNLIRPFEKLGGAIHQSNVYETVCNIYTEVMCLTALNVLSLQNYCNHICESYEIAIVANIKEHITVYKSYIKAICDIIALGGFMHIAKIISVSQTLSNLFYEHAKDSSGIKNNNELIILMALQYPLCALKRYETLVQKLSDCNQLKEAVEPLHEAYNKWKKICYEQRKRQKEAEATKVFWENSDKLVQPFRLPNRRLVRDSHVHPIWLLSAGRFSLSHRFILFNDQFLHITGSWVSVLPLKTLWVEPIQDTDLLQNAISVITPEENLTLYTSSPAERSEWLQALQRTIQCHLGSIVRYSPLIVRSSSFYFTKHSVFKNAKFTGRWANGKPHGTGKLEWADGTTYVGEFHKGVMQGSGKMEIPSQSTYEGQWQDNKQNGYGIMKYSNGDIYEGYFKDGLPHGHGIRKEGSFTSSIASIYIGEWVAGMKQGYGVMDDIMTGEKYLGSWSNDMKHGCGLIVTLDGIYYEGIFMQNVLTGYGIMVFENGSYYEGGFKSAGVFCGKGTLRFNSGVSIEGNMNGMWNEGIEVAATLRMNAYDNSKNTDMKPPSFGKLCVPPDKKWRSIFHQLYEQLGISECNGKDISNETNITQSNKVWQNVAVFMSKSYQRTVSKNCSIHSPQNKRTESTDDLNKIPCFGSDRLTFDSYEQINKYLTRAFECTHHPLGTLLTELTTVYTGTYGGVRVHPLLLTHAVSELQSIISRMYDVLIILFPILPKGNQEYVIEGEKGDSKKISVFVILCPIILPRVHFVLFVLYAMHNKEENDTYWEKLLKWNRKDDSTLMRFLDIDSKFWQNSTAIKQHVQGNGKELFSEAAETLQQLKTTFSPFEKLLVIKRTFEQITQDVHTQLGSAYLWTMDELLPVFTFVVIRSSVSQLGSEIQFIEDFMDPHLQNGEDGIMFTTLKASYHQILREVKHNI